MEHQAHAYLAYLAHLLCLADVVGSLVYSVHAVEPVSRITLDALDALAPTVLAACTECTEDPMARHDAACIGMPSNIVPAAACWPSLWCTCYILLDNPAQLVLSRSIRSREVHENGVKIAVILRQRIDDTVLQRYLVCQL